MRRTRSILNHSTNSPVHAMMQPCAGLGFVVGVSESRNDAPASRAAIIGSGLIARAFAPHADALPNVCVYAAGVSNSSCTDPREFEGERERLRAAMAKLPDTALLLYFSTCSINDPALQDSRYVVHKRAMESVV